MHRPTVGLLAIVLLATAAILFFAAPEGVDNKGMLMSGCLRVGVVLGAIWLAHPQLVRVPTWAYQLGVVIAIVIAVRPRTAFVLVPLLFLIWLIKPRQKPTRGNPSRRQD